MYKEYKSKRVTRLSEKQTIKCSFNFNAHRTFFKALFDLFMFKQLYIFYVFILFKDYRCDSSTCKMYLKMGILSSFIPLFENEGEYDKETIVCWLLSVYII